MSSRRFTKSGSVPTRRASGLRAAKAAANSFGAPALNMASSNPSERAASCTKPISGTASGLIGLTSIATMDALGASSRTISSRFCPSTTLISVIPVALPPGRLTLATRPAETGSKPTTNTIGNGGGRCFGRERGRRRLGQNQGDGAADQIGRHGRQPLVLTIGPAEFQGDVVALRETDFIQASAEGDDQVPSLLLR